ncbi:MAG TPA: ATP-binding protein [Bacteroidales bacterium]|nr:ATP-binding protein [Bacteroidales bacterium]HRS18053.1 ATP-binding protein [Bacteroidales bacterium]
MNQIQRTLQQEIEKRLKPNKVMLLLGARRVGKTILIKKIISNFTGKVLMLNGEDSDSLVLLANRSISNYQNLLKGIDLLVIDEAQNVPEIGQKLKLIVDEIPNIKVIASGSSSFDLLNFTGEPLVGRSYTLYLHPFSQQELGAIENALETKQNLESRLIYGSYPELISLDNTDKKEYLNNIVNSYLLKDILIIDGIRNASKMLDLLRLIAFQTGNLVAYDELGKQLGMSKNTVEKYLDLLSKVFVIYRLGAYSKNLRKEISKSSKWYFYDTGIRNAIIGNFAPLALRNDVGQLWESYILSERIKQKCFNVLNTQHFFWRTYDGQELDIVEIEDTTIRAFECKWNTAKAKIPVAFAQAYSEAQFSVISQDNYLEFIG